MKVKKRGNNKHYGCRFEVEGKEYSFEFNGKKGQPLITKKDKAIEKAVDIRRGIISGTFVKQTEWKTFKNFFDDVFLDYSRQHKSEKCLEFDELYGVNLTDEFGDKTLRQITPRQIENFLLKLSRKETRFKKPYSPCTVRKHYNMMNQLFNMAIRERVLNDNPCRLVKPNVLKQFPVWENRERWLNKYEPVEVVNKRGKKEVATEEQRLFRAFNDQGEHLVAISRIVLNTGIRPPKEVLSIKKSHVNLSEDAKYVRVENRDMLIPPRSVLIEKGKTGPRTVPLNKIAFEVFSVLVRDETTGEWLFTNRNGGRMKTIKRGFASACGRAGLEDFRSYDLRHTFATRLLERGVHHYVISALLGHSMPVAGFGAASRVTPGYAHATWDSMVSAVESLEKEPMDVINIFSTEKGEKKTEKEIESDKTRTNVRKLRMIG